MALTTSLIAFWELEEASGTRNDSHGANHLTDNNTVASTTGKVGDCADFESGNSEYLSRADNADLSTGDIDFSLSLWINMESTGGFPPAISRRSGSGPADNEYALYYFGGLVWAVGAVGATSATLSTATWYHVVVWHEAGVGIGIVIDDGTPVTQAGAYDAIGTANSFELGAITAQGLYWDGLIDQVGFWKKKLSAGEITQLYNSGNGLSYAAMAPAGRQTKNTRAFPLGLDIGMNRGVL